MVDQQTVSTLSLINRAVRAEHGDRSRRPAAGRLGHVWEDEDVTDPFRARQVLWLPVPLAGRVALAAGRPQAQPVPRARARSAAPATRRRRPHDPNVEPQLRPALASLLTSPMRRLIGSGSRHRPAVSAAGKPCSRGLPRRRWPTRADDLGETSGETSTLCAAATAGRLPQSPVPLWWGSVLTAPAPAACWGSLSLRPCRIR
jgi:hypothetical protein